KPAFKGGLAGWRWPTGTLPDSSSIQQRWSSGQAPTQQQLREARICSGTIMDVNTSIPLDFSACVRVQC
uniref:Uncharacterized protein n=1 Tax=Anopheles albimanus TaxID=7167 RepID=A0A182FYB5_ANOAL